MEFTELPQFELNAELIRLLSEDFCRTNHVILLGPEPESKRFPISLGMLDPSREDIADEVERILARKVRRVQLNSYEVDTAIAFGFGHQLSEEGKGDLSEGRQSALLHFQSKIEFSRDQPSSKIFLDTLSEAVTRRATDVHIETYCNDVDLRFRIDGIMHQITTPLSMLNVRSVISYIKVMADLDISDHRRPQDGRLEAFYNAEDGSCRHISLRVSVLPGPYGEDVVFRVLDEGRMLMGLNDLGMNPKMLKKFGGMINSPGGMILVTGPTASGKSTTLYASVHTLALLGRKILSVEDPIEFEIPKVNQKQVTSHMSFADYARAFMRQNPDILMIGEVRDEETASIALRAAQMGHLVLTTLHTPDSFSAIGRMVNLGVDKSLLLSGLLGVLSQRLVRKNCPKCSESYSPDPQIFERIPNLSREAKFIRGKGCKFCSGTGFFERVGVFELLEFDEELKREISFGTELSLASLAKMVTFDRLIDDAKFKLEEGVTAVEEVLRSVPIMQK